MEMFLTNVLYYQQLSITRYQVSFYVANNYLEKLPILSSVLQGQTEHHHREQCKF